MCVRSSSDVKWLREVMVILVDRGISAAGGDCEQYTAFSHLGRGRHVADINLDDAVGLEGDEDDVDDPEEEEDKG